MDCLEYKENHAGLVYFPNKTKTIDVPPTELYLKLFHNSDSQANRSELQRLKNS